MSAISIHALVKRATDMLANAERHRGISIHALVKRATYNCWREKNDGINFNPRPREEGDPLAEPTSVPISISIHALVKRATIIDNRSCAAEDISIHALVKRATIIWRFVRST